MKEIYKIAGKKFSKTILAYQAYTCPEALTKVTK